MSCNIMLFAYGWSANNQCYLGGSVIKKPDGDGYQFRAWNMNVNNIKGYKIATNLWHSAV